jgi:hypothetical protein
MFVLKHATPVSSLIIPNRCPSDYRPHLPRKELQHKRSNDPKPLPPCLSASLLPQGSWQDAARELYAACMQADNSTLDWLGHHADPAICPNVVVLLAASDRNMGASPPPPPLPCSQSLNTPGQ